MAANPEMFKPDNSRQDEEPLQPIQPNVDNADEQLDFNWSGGEKDLDREIIDEPIVRQDTTQFEEKEYVEYPNQPTQPNPTTPTKSRLPLIAVGVVALLLLFKR